MELVSFSIHISMWQQRKFQLIFTKFPVEISVWTNIIGWAWQLFVLASMLVKLVKNELAKCIRPVTLFSIGEEFFTRVSRDYLTTRLYRRFTFSRCLFLLFSTSEKFHFAKEHLNYNNSLNTLNVEVLFSERNQWPFTEIFIIKVFLLPMLWKMKSFVVGISIKTKIKLLFDGFYVVLFVYWSFGWLSCIV